MSLYFISLSNENASVLFQQIKQQINKLNVDWSFEWFEYIRNHPDKSWDYESMCGNPNVTWELIQAYPQLFNDYRYMCENLNISWDILQTFPQTTDIYFFASSNPNITLAIVNQNPDKPFAYRFFTCNSSFTFYEMLNLFELEFI